MGLAQQKQDSPSCCCRRSCCTSGCLSLCSKGILTKMVSAVHNSIPLRPRCSSNPHGDVKPLHVAGWIPQCFPHDPPTWCGPPRIPPPQFYLSLLAAAFTSPTLALGDSDTVVLDPLETQSCKLHRRWSGERDRSMARAARPVRPVRKEGVPVNRQGGRSLLHSRLGSQSIEGAQTNTTMALTDGREMVRGFRLAGTECPPIFLPSRTPGPGHDGTERGPTIFKRSPRNRESVSSLSLQSSLRTSESQRDSQTSHPQTPST